MVSAPIILTNHAKRKRMQRLAQHTRNKIVYRRCQIILHLADGGTPSGIAAQLGCHVSTVYRTRQAYLRDGHAALRPKASPGRPRKLDAAQVQRLDELLQQEPRSLGQAFSNWTVKYLWIQVRWVVHPITLWRYLRRLAWRWSRPVPRIASPDPRYAAKARYLRCLRAQARQAQIHLYYADEMDVELLPTISGRWMRRGQQTQVATPGQNAKQYVYGAVHYTRGDLCWLSWAHKDNAGFRHLLAQLLAHHRRDARRIVVVVDNYRIHRAQPVRAWLQQHRRRIRLYFLPTYAPRLNPIERVWRYVRRNVTDNYFFRTLRHLQTSVEAFLSQLARSPATLLSIVA